MKAPVVLVTFITEFTLRVAFDFLVEMVDWVTPHLQVMLAYI